MPSRQSDFPRLRAIVYFNSNKDYWQLTTSDAAFEAFRQLAYDLWFMTADGGPGVTRTPLAADGHET